MSKSPVKKATKKRYNWPPPVAPEDAYVPKQKNPIHSILSALPVIMLVAGLYIYYKGESEQSHSAPIRAESIELVGVFAGLSVVQSSSQGRHYLWMDVDGKSRGLRVQPLQSESLQQLDRGETITVDAAPSISGSSTLWIWRVEHSGVILLDAGDDLQ